MLCYVAGYAKAYGQRDCWQNTILIIAPRMRTSQYHNTPPLQRSPHIRAL